MFSPFVLYPRCFYFNINTFKQQYLYEFKMNKYMKILDIFQYINLSSKESFIINELKMKL